LDVHMIENLEGYEELMAQMYKKYGTDTLLGFADASLPPPRHTNSGHSNSGCANKKETVGQMPFCLFLIIVSLLCKRQITSSTFR
jgi:hypothetical protein